MLERHSRWAVRRVGRRHSEQLGQRAGPIVSDFIVAENQLVQRRVVLQSFDELQYGLDEANSCIRVKHIVSNLHFDACVTQLQVGDRRVLFQSIPQKRQAFIGNCVQAASFAPETNGTP